MSSSSQRARWARPFLLPTIALALVGLVRPAAAQHPVAAGADGREVPLSELLAHAERHAPALQVAERRRGYAEASRAAARPLLHGDPTVEAGVGPRFNQDGERDFDFVVALGQPIEIAGERRRRLEAASRERERRDAEADAARWELRREVVLAYAAAVVARERATILEAMAGFADEMLTVARRRLESGDATAIDVRLAEAEVARARQAQIGAGAELRTARIALAEVTGWALETPPNVPAGLGAPGAAPSLTAVMELAEATHPALRARRAAVDEARARVELAEREAWPSPVLGVQVAREGATGGPANHVVLGTLGLSLPVWQRSQGERARSRVDEAVARAEEGAIERALRARIARAHAELVAATERVALFTEGVASHLEEGLSLLRRGFEAGELPLLTVALARERFLDARRDALVAYADAYRARAELEFAIGAALPAADETTGGAP